MRENSKHERIIVYSFLITLETGEKGVSAFHTPVWLWALPITFPVLILIRGLAFHHQVQMIAEYIKSVEKQYGRKPLGWENREKRKWRERALTGSNLLFVIILFGFSAWVLWWRLYAFR